MKISRLLEQNEMCKGILGISDNFGDQYLCKNNSIYSKIRQRVLDGGVRFSNERNDFYQALPLSQLDSILENKIIPYNDNVGILKNLTHQMGSSLQWDDICDNLKKNYLFHESCHVVARAEAIKIFGKSDNFQNSEDRNFQILRLMLEESFANACELLSIIEAQDQSHRIFFECNSYICMFDDRINLKNATAEFGINNFFPYLILNYLQAHFLRDGLNEKEFNRICRLILPQKNLTPVQIKTLKALGKIAFQLNPRFREVTTSFYLRMKRFPGTLDVLLGFDFMKILEEDDRFFNLIQNLSRIIS